MLFVTDGNPTSGNTDVGVINDLSNTFDGTIFAIGVGDVNTDTLAAITKPDYNVYLVAEFPSIAAMIDEISLAACPDDWGDLPETGTSFETLLTNNGPRHIIGDLFLGPAIDDDPNGFPGDGSDGNDLDNINDEDGLVRGGLLWVPGNTVSLTATFSGDNGYLVSWFDWDQNGIFIDTGELRDWGPVISGTNSLTVTVGASFVPDNGLYVRFRLFEDAGSIPRVPVEPIVPTGRAINGKVEDYRWLFTPTAITLYNQSIGDETSDWLLIGAAAFMLLAAITIYILGRRQRLTR